MFLKRSIPAVFFKFPIPGGMEEVVKNGFGGKGGQACARKFFGVSPTLRRMTREK